MASTPKQRSRFGEQLRAELGRQDLSIRQLAKRMDPEKPEQTRRALARWIAGTKPTGASRRAVAEALGVDVSVFDDPDDAEADQAVLEFARFFGDLKSRLRAVESKLAQYEGAAA